MADLDTNTSEAPLKKRGVIAQWIHTNIVGDKPSSDFSQRVEPDHITDDEDIRRTMDDLEFMPPPVVTAKGEINPDSVHFFVKKFVEKLIDLAVSGLAALLVWILFRLTGKHVPESPGQEWADKLETIAPAVIWLGCYLRLAYRRMRRRSESGSR